MTFDAADPGTPGSAWRDSGYRATLPALDIGPMRHLVVVAAHPDDETLMAGGLIAAAGARGLPVDVVVASGGEASHPGSPTRTPASLREEREREVRAAVTRLDPAARLHLLGLPDGSLGSRVERIAQAVQRLLVDGSVVVSTWSGDGHPDHAAVAAAAERAATAVGALRLQAPIWAWHRDRPQDEDWPPAARLDLETAAADAKRAAILLHTTQVEPLSDAAGDEVLLHAGMLEHFTGDDEVYFPSGPAQPVDFDAMYASADDPWGFADRWYERRKRAVLLAALPQARFHRALEIGCSGGLLTAELAGRADVVVGTDVARSAVAQARDRFGGRPAVTIEQRDLPAQWAREWVDDPFDLIVLSEVGFYLAGDALGEVVDRARASLGPGGVFVACHWRPRVLGLDRGGDEVHRVVRERIGGVRLVLHEEDDFVLEVFQLPPAQSVARATGLR